MLENITVLDFSHRLPGPLAGNILGKMGAKVIKIEDVRFGDAFHDGFFAGLDVGFQHWYEELNNTKEILSLDFNQDKDKVWELVNGCDAILLGIPKKVQEKLGMTVSDLAKISRPLAVIQMGASQKVQKAMHDINAMAIEGLLSLYVADKNSAILAPPFLPTSGIAFGQQIATQLLACLVKAQQEKQPVFDTAYLYETVEDVLAPFWPAKLRQEGKTKFLHNGAYPCYCLYQTQDGHYVALGAVEEKFWVEFCSLFEVDIKPENRFSRNVEEFEQVAAKIASYTKEEISKKVADKNICLSIVEKPAS